MSVFRGGIPYALDVQKILEAKPPETLTEGLLLRHEQLEGILSLKRATVRYYSVINAWRSRIKHAFGIFAVWEPGEGVKILDPAGVLVHAETRTRQKSRQLIRCIRIFGWVDGTRLNEEGKRRLDHQLASSARLSYAVAQSAKEMAVDISPVQSLPKRPPYQPEC